ncbi:glycosyltransferase [Microbacterium sp. NPDC056057]|uniref:glycosyltransferase n=1 Tax=Microbacterium sp. NPDC056057 TaxID=3345699 RepID=UPI0035E07239
MTTSESAAPLRVLVLGTADWNQPIATNQHYMVRELCRDGFAEVTFVESIALRRPEMSARDLRRIGRRLRVLMRGRDQAPASSPGRPIPEGLTVRTPIVVPVHTGPLSRPNRLSLQRLVSDWLQYPGPKALWTYTPITYGLEAHADVTIYHCVDLLGTVRGISSRAVSQGERALAAHGAISIASSDVVADHLRAVGLSPILWENVADTAIFAAAGPLDQQRMPGRVFFAGNLSPSKVDYSLLEQLADAGLEVRVAGPRAEGGGNDSKAFASLADHGVTYLGMLSLPEVARELASSTVGLIPYVINDYTRGVSPLKTYEYLASGVAVVATDLPGVTADEINVWRVRSAEGFVKTVIEQSGVPSRKLVEDRIRASDSHSWIGRGHQARSLMSDTFADLEGQR